MEENHITLEGISSYGNSKKLIAHLEPFLGKDLNEKLLSDRKSTIHAYYKEEGYPFVVAAIPQQDTSNSSLKIKILEGVVGKMSYKGNRTLKLYRSLGNFISV